MIYCLVELHPGYLKPEEQERDREAADRQGRLVLSDAALEGDRPKRAVDQPLAVVNARCILQ